MRITRVRQSDNGDWKCNVTAKDANGEYDIVVGKIQLIVAIPPVEVSMKMGEKFITGPIKINLEEQKKASNISCVATGARPAPKFKWTIGDNEILNSNTTTSEELLDEGRGTAIIR